RVLPSQCPDALCHNGDSLSQRARARPWSAGSKTVGSLYGRQKTERCIFIGPQVGAQNPSTCSVAREETWIIVLPPLTGEQPHRRRPLMGGPRGGGPATERLAVPCRPPLRLRQEEAEEPATRPCQRHQGAVGKEGAEADPRFRRKGHEQLA